MDDQNIASRRSVLKGITAFAAVAASVVPAIASQAKASEELKRLADTYAKAQRRLTDADAPVVGLASSDYAPRQLGAAATTTR